MQSQDLKLGKRGFMTPKRVQSFRSPEKEISSKRLAKVSPGTKSSLFTRSYSGVHKLTKISTSLSEIIKSPENSKISNPEIQPGKKGTFCFPLKTQKSPSRPGPVQRSTKEITKRTQVTPSKKPHKANTTTQNIRSETLVLSGLTVGYTKALVEDMLKPLKVISVNITSKTTNGKSSKSATVVLQNPSNSALASLRTLLKKKGLTLKHLSEKEALPQRPQKIPEFNPDEELLFEPVNPEDYCSEISLFGFQTPETSKRIKRSSSFTNSPTPDKSTRPKAKSIIKGPSELQVNPDIPDSVPCLPTNSSSNSTQLGTPNFKKVRFCNRVLVLNKH